MGQRENGALRSKKEESKSEYNKLQVIIIGIAATGASIFGYFQLSFFSTYVDHVLGEPPIAIAIMASLSAIFAVVYFLIIGVFSDNTRSRFGRRRPYLLFGILSGIAMILFGFITNFVSGLLLRLLVIELGINGYYAVQRTLVADLVPLEYRGRANGVATLVGTLGMIIAVGVTLIANAFYVEAGNLNQEGHLLLYCVGGISIIICSIFCFIFLKEPPASSLPPRKGFLEDLKDTFQIEELKKNKEYFKMVLASSIFVLGLLLIGPYIFIYVFSLEMSNLELAMVAGIAAPIVVGAVMVLGKLADSIGRKQTIIPVIFITSIGYIMIPFVASSENRNMPLLIIALSLALIGFVGVLVPVGAWQSDLLPEDKRAQFVGILNVINTLTQIPGAVIGALIYEYLGIQYIFAFVPIFSILSVPFFMRIKETLQREE